MLQADVKVMIVLLAARSRKTGFGMLVEKIGQSQQEERTYEQ